MKRLLLVVGTLALGAATACSFVVGSLSECTSTSDCASKGAGLTCVDSLCVSGGAVDAGTDAGPAVLRDPLCQDVYGNADGGNILRIGAVVPKSTSTGAVDIRGVYRGHAIQLATDQVNLKSALPGVSLVIRVCDDTGNNTTAASEATELLDEGAVALVTTGSAQTHSIAGVAVSRGAALMAISATAVQVQSDGIPGDGGPKQVWSTAISDSFQAQVLAQMMIDGGAIGSGAAPFHAPVCIHADDVAFNGLYDQLTQDLPPVDGGLNLPQFLYETTPTDDPTAQVQQAMAAAPDAVVLISTVGDTALLLNAWTAPDPVWLFTDNARSTSLYAFDGGLQRLAGAQGTGPSTPSVANLEYSSFKALFTNGFPDAGDPATVSYVPNAYDAVLLLSAGALWSQSHGGVSGTHIAAGLGQLSDTTQAAVSLDADDFATFQAAFAQGHAVNVKGASGALDFSSAIGVAPGPIDVWTLAPDGGIVTLRTVVP